MTRQVSRVPEKRPNSARAEKLLDCRPDTRLRDGLKKTYEWAERRLYSETASLA